MKNLTEGNIYKNFILFSLPMLITEFLSQLFGAVDTALAGKMLGDSSVAAIGTTSPLITLISCASSGYAIGFSIYIAKLFGARQFSKIKQSLYSVLIVTGCFFSIFIAVLISSRNLIMHILNVEDVLLEQAIEYFTVYCISLLFMMFRYIFTYFLHAFGDTVYALIVSLGCSVLHMSCSFLFVGVIKGRFASVGGLAFVNCLSSALACVLLFIKIRHYFKQMGIKQHFKPDLRSVTDVLPYSLPTMLQQMIMYTSDVMISPLINALIVAQLSAYTISNKMYHISSQTFSSSSKALSNYAAQCIGAGKYDKIKKGIKASALQGALLLMPLVLLCSIFSNNIAGIFFHAEKDGSSLSYLVVYLKSYMPFMFFNIINNLFHSFFRGIKAMKHLLLITTVGSFSKYLFSLVLFEKHQIHGIWLAIVFSWIVEACTCIVLYFIGAWKKHITGGETPSRAARP